MTRIHPDDDWWSYVDQYGAPERPTERGEIDDLGRLHVELLLQIDQVDHELRRVRRWLLLNVVLLLAVTAVITLRFA